MRKYWEDDKKDSEIKSKPKPEAEKKQNKEVEINPKVDNDNSHVNDEYYDLLAMYISTLPEEEKAAIKEEFQNGNAKIILKKVK